MRTFFVRILFGNLASKLLLIAADGLAALALPRADFGAFAFLQSLILSGAVIAAWGNEQAAISIIGRVDRGKHDLAGYFSKVLRIVFIRGVVVAALCALLAVGSRFTFTPRLLLIVCLIVMLEAQLIINAAVFRSFERPYAAVALFDGMRHLFLFVGALIIIQTETSFETLLHFWLGSAAASYSVGKPVRTRLVVGSGDAPIPENDKRHAADISRFSGLWAVIQTLISRVVLVFSAYILSPEDVGTVAFFMKLMVIFTFFQTVTSQSFAPIIGKVSKKTNLDQASRVYRLSAFFLAAVTAPLIAVSLLMMGSITDAFQVPYDGIEFAVTILLFAQAINIGTGIIGQFIIHFGYARHQLLISVVGASIQCVLLLLLGVRFGVAGVLFSYAASSVVLVIMKNVVAARTIGLHGFTLPNLLIVGMVVCEVLVLQSVSGAPSIDPVVLLIGHVGFSAAVIVLAAGLMPEVKNWWKIRARENA